MRIIDILKTSYNPATKRTVGFTKFLKQIPSKYAKEALRLKNLGLKLSKVADILDNGYPLCKVCKRKITDSTTLNIGAKTCSKSCGTVYGMRISRRNVARILSKIDASPLTETTLESLRVAYRRYSEDYEYTYLPERQYLGYLSKEDSKLLPYYKYLVENVSVANTKRSNSRISVIKGKSLNLECSVCKLPMCSLVSKVCSDKCSILAKKRIKEKQQKRKSLAITRRKELRKSLLKQACLLFSKVDTSLNPIEIKLGKLGSRQRAPRVVCECALCSKKKVLRFPKKNLSGIWTCSCDRARKIREGRAYLVYGAEKKNKALFLSKDFKSRNLKVSGYVNFRSRVNAECLKCGFKFQPFPYNLVSGHGCRVCSMALSRDTLEKKHGVRSFNLVPATRAKIRQTMLKRYGVEHANQNPEIFARALRTSSKAKPYVLGNRKIQVQGFEPHALDYLQKVKKLKASDIEAGIGNPKIPVITYYVKGKEHKYFPDIFIPSKNRVMEVKSTFSYAYNKRINLLKEIACRKAGYKFSFLVMSKSGKRTNEPTPG